MRILILTQEAFFSSQLKEWCQKILDCNSISIHCLSSFISANSFLSQHPIDLCLLDVSMDRTDTFKLLTLNVAGSFHTIIFSNTGIEAVEAFRYGVLDYIVKPVTEDRLHLAFVRYLERVEKNQCALRYLTVRKNHQMVLIPVADIVHFKAADVYVEAMLRNGQVELLDKTLNRLEKTLPGRFFRSHRSFIIDLTQIKSYGHVGGGGYKIRTVSDAIIPLSRIKYKELQMLLNN